MDFWEHEIEKRKNQQEIKLNTIGATPHNKPAVLPVNIINSKDKNQDITDGYRFNIPVNPDEWD